MTCPSCASNDVFQVEALTTAEVAEGWGREFPESKRLILQSVRDGQMPARFRMMGCFECKLEYADPMFAAGADWYEIQERYGDRWEFEECLRALAGRSLDLFEIGCGEGYFLDAARRAGHRARGIDFNEKAVAVAKQKGLDASVADLKALPAGAKPDAVMLFHVIEHLDDPPAFFRELAAATSPGTSLFLSCPGPRRYTTDLVPDGHLGKRDLFDYPPLHQTRWCESAARRLLERTGWRMNEYREEPFGLKGHAGFLVAHRAKLDGKPLESRQRFVRRLLIARKMLALALVRHRYSGMSMFVRATREG